MTNLISKLYEKAAKNRAFVAGSAFMWQNGTRVAIENATDADPDASTRAMIVATGVKLVVGPAYKWGREKGINYFKSKGKINPLSKNNGKRTFDRAYGPAVGIMEAAVNTGAYYFLFREPSFAKSALIGLSSAAPTFLGNLNGKLIDTALELNNMPNLGRGFVPANMPLEKKKQIRDTANAILVGYPIVYSLAMKAASLFY